jgi:hypothetical protein
VPSGTLECERLYARSIDEVEFLVPVINVPCCPAAARNFMALPENRECHSTRRQIVSTEFADHYRLFMLPWE